MKRILTTIQKKANRILLLSVLAGAMASCDSVLDYEEGDCSIEYRVKFKYDYNMQERDAFAAEVRTVTLYAFDDSGKLVYQNTESGEALGTGDYSMKVDMEPGNYHLIAWAGLNDESFAVPLLTPSSSELNDLKVKTLRTAFNGTRAESEEEKFIVDKQLHSLWHGELTKGSFTRSNGREQYITVPLVKNTNNIHIVIAQVDKDQPVTRAISSNKIACTIYDDNGYMNYDNSLLSDNLLTYKPYVLNNGTIKTRALSDTNEEEEYNAASYELSVGRLMANKTPKLTIYDTEFKKTIFSTDDLNSYLELLRADHYSKYGKQEYLDREDEYNMIFFVDGNLSLLKGFILINDWKVQINDFDLQ